MVSLLTSIKPERVIIIFLAFFYFSDLKAQSYSGALVIQDSLSFPYYLNLNLDRNIGYSVSDISGPTETLSLIKVRSLDNEKSYRVEEANVIYTKLKPEAYDDFCKILFKSKFNSSNIDTEFSAVLSDNTSCGMGLIKLETTKKLSEKLKKAQSKIENNKLLKSLTSQNDRTVSVEKINDLLQLAKENYIKNIPLKRNDFIDFLHFRGIQKIVLTFNRDIPKHLTNKIKAPSGQVLVKNNVVIITKYNSYSSIPVLFNDPEFKNYSFDVVINTSITLRFTFPTEFSEANFIF